MNYSESLLFHGGDTGSTPVRDASNSSLARRSKAASQTPDRQHCDLPVQKFGNIPLLRQLVPSCHQRRSIPTSRVVFMSTSRIENRLRRFSPRSTHLASRIFRRHSSTLHAVLRKNQQQLVNAVLRRTHQASSKYVFEVLTFSGQREYCPRIIIERLNPEPPPQQTRFDPARNRIAASRADWAKHLKP